MRNAHCAQLVGIHGLITLRAIVRELNKADAIELPADEQSKLLSYEVDARSESNIATLDPMAQEKFRRFLLLANATAATFGCSYVMIGGNRTYAEQDALYAQGRTKPGNIITNAKGGQSDHNFGIAGDMGVFRGKAYLDETDRALAARVHKACSMHAEACGLEWGGSWTSFIDLPHYQIKTGLTLAQMREAMQKKGSVL